MVDHVAEEVDANCQDAGVVVFHFRLGWEGDGCCGALGLDIGSAGKGLAFAGDDGEDRGWVGV